LSLTVGYMASGKLALLLAVPPGYASPIFPPAGIAIAAMLIGGPATLPWTFLGSFLLNVWTAYSVGHGSAVTWLAAAGVIAAGSTLQAAIGGTVLRRAVGYPAPLDNGRDLWRFLFLSPLSCLTSATLSLGGLLALGVVLLPDLVTSWVSWWIGDTVGVLVVLPLMFVIAGEPRSLWRSRAGPVALPMLLFFALFIAIFVRVSTWEHDEALLEFRLRSRRSSINYMLALRSRKSSSSNWRDPSAVRRRFLGLTFNIWPRICCSAFRRSRRSNGRRESIFPIGWDSRRRNIPTCQGSKYKRLILRGNGAVPQSETDTTR
jgi:integral membrane sensor domain MASE1